MPKKLTQEQFENNSNLVHNHIYCYSDSTFINIRTPVIIYCSAHEIYFSQNPGVHIYQGCGCPECSREGTLTFKMKGRDYYISEAIKLFSNKYNYDNVPENILKKDPIEIICCACGNIFVTTFGRHLGIKQECKCQKPLDAGKPKIISYDSFVSAAEIIHNKKYKYENVVFKNSYTPVLITCQEHGDFPQRPNCHVKGNGCPECAHKEGGDKCRTFEKTFLTCAYDIHGDIFGYDDMNFINSKTPISILCLSGNHVFNRTPEKHLISKGCPICMGRYKTLDDFIKEVEIIHDYFYTYDNAVYENNHTDLLVTCPKHGDFPITPRNHRQGKGCPICRESQGEKLLRKLFKKYGIIYKRQYKFEDCKHIQQLRFDFGILDNLEKLLGLVEYQGIQHYIPTDFSSNLTPEELSEEFTLVQLRDQIKKTYCETNNISLLCIPYFEKIPESLLIDFLKYELKLEVKESLNVKEYFSESFLKPFPKHQTKHPSNDPKSSLTSLIKDGRMGLEEI